MPSGRFERRPDTAERDADAARLRASGRSYTQIANALGFADRSGARRAAQRALVAIVHEAGEELRTLEAERLNHLLAVAWQVMERVHFASSAGRLIRDGDALVVDDGPVLQAIDPVLRVMERRSKLLGLDAPGRHEVLSMDAIDAELARLEREHAGLAARDEDQQVPQPKGAADLDAGSNDSD